MQLLRYRQFAMRDNPPPFVRFRMMMKPATPVCQTTAKKLYFKDYRAISEIDRVTITFDRKVIRHFYSRQACGAYDSLGGKIQLSAGSSSKGMNIFLNFIPYRLEFLAPAATRLEMHINTLKSLREILNYYKYS